MTLHRTFIRGSLLWASTGRFVDRPFGQALEAWLSSVVDLGLMAVLLFAPLFMGGRHPTGKLVLAVIIWTTAIAWLAKQCLQRRAEWSWSGAEIILLLSSVLVVAQVCPWPAAGRQLLSPAQAELLPLWSTQQLYGAWQYVSLTPERTRQGLCLFLAYAALFLISYQRIRTVADVERLLRWIAVAAVGMAGLGLLQYLIGNGKFLWLYEHPTRSTHLVAKGSFANQNHFAHFLALGVGPLIWCLQDWYRKSSENTKRFSARRSSRGASAYMSTLLATGLGLVAFAGLLSFSRGGWLVISLAGLVCVGIYAVNGFVNKRTIVLLLGILLVMTTAVVIHGHQRLQSRLNTITAGSLEEIDARRGRRKIWSAVGKAIPHFAVMGAGVGSHRDVYPTFMKEGSKIEYSHAENGFLQVLLETGIPGLLLLLGAICLGGFWLVSTLWHSSSRRISVIGGALAAGWAATVIHSLVDFVWYIPACASVTILLAAATGRLYRLSTDAQPRQTTYFSRPGWLVCMIVVAGIGVLSVHAQLGPARAARYWEKYLVMSLSAEDTALDRMRNSREVRFGEVDDSDPETLVRMTSLLQDSIARDPNDARSHLRLAATHLSHFAILQKSSENAMSLRDIRDAAVMSQFPSRAAQDAWLDVAIGEHRYLLDEALRHAKHAVRLSPLLGKGYLHLAELSFLEGLHRHRDALIAQAKQARPHDSAVLYLIGAEAHLVGDMKTATEHYQQAFNRESEMQDLIISMLAPSVKPHEFIATFQPDRAGLGKLYHHYRNSSADLNARFVAQHYVRALEQHGRSASGAVAARSWYLAQEVHGFLRQLPASLAAARYAVAADPSDYRLRYTLAVRLQQRGDLEQAVDQLRWCLRRRPDDKAVLQRLARLAQDASR